MFRTTLTRTAVRAPRVARRSYATAPQTSDQPNKPPAGGSNTLLYGALVAAAGAGAYWYYTHPDEVADAQKKAKAQEEELKRKAKDLELSGKAKAEGLYKEGQAKIDQAKASTESSLHSAEARARQLGNQVRGEYSDKTLPDAKNAAEGLYKEGRANAKSKAEEAKAGWFSWLGWGKAKAEEGKKDIKEKL